VEKTAIVDALGAEGLLAPARVARGLEANDRAKYYLTLLQAARARAEFPDRPIPDLSAERQAARIDDIGLDDAVADARRLDGGVLAIPQADRIFEEITACLRTMAEAVGPGERGCCSRTISARRTPMSWS